MSERMEWLGSRYPSGAVGLGLLMLRAVTASYLLYNAATTGVVTNDADVSVAVAAIGMATLAASLLLAMGLRTPWAACTGATTLVAADWHARVVHVVADSAQGWFNTVSFALVTALLFVLGPGAYSLDALFRGSRTIHLSSRHTWRGGKP
jgi:uncharacterized membrane protein YphA (DoxX/SURF4 family)